MENQNVCKTTRLQGNFILKETLKVGQVIVRLYDYSIGHERFLELKMLFVNSINLLGKESKIEPFDVNFDVNFGPLAGFSIFHERAPKKTPLKIKEKWGGGGGAKRRNNSSTTEFSSFSS